MGWRILPIWWPTAEGTCACGYADCKAIAKHPCAELAPNGLHDATTESEVIEAWFEIHPELNIAVDLAASGLMALDVDHPDGPTAAAEKLGHAIEKYGQLPETIQQISGSGNAHLFYKAPLTAIRGELDGITIRGKNYCVIAPSIHKSGNAYAWEPGYGPTEAEAVDLPINWQAALHKADPIGDVGVPDNEPDWLKAIPETTRVMRMRTHLMDESGERMGIDPAGTCFHVARTCARGYAVREAEAVVQAMMELYAPRCQPPYAHNDIVQRVWKAYEQAHSPEWGAEFEPASAKKARLVAGIGGHIPEQGPIAVEATTHADLLSAERVYAKSKDGKKLLAHRLLKTINKREPLEEDDTLEALKVVVVAAPRASAEELAAHVSASLPKLTPDELIEMFRELRKQIGTGWVEVPTAEDDDELRALLKVNDKGKASASDANLLMILCRDSNLKDRLRFDEVNKQVTCDGIFADEPLGTLDVAIATYLSSRYDIDVNHHKVGAHVLRTAQKYGKYDSLATYLNSLEWDGRPRADDWLLRYCNAELTSLGKRNIEGFVRDVGFKWLLGAVARGLCPGSKMDTVLVLEGEQGDKKSTAFAILGGNWFTDSQLVIGDKDSRMLAASQWMVELAELASMMSAETETQKAFLSAREDKFRPPYGRVIESFKRRCVFGGTVNPGSDGESHYLLDHENRRWWPVRVGAIDAVQLEHDRDQLLGEVVQRYSEGLQYQLNDTRPSAYRWWFTKAEWEDVKFIAEERREEDPWADVVLSWAKGQASGRSPIGTAAASRDNWTLNEVAYGALKLNASEFRRHSKALTNSLVRAGFYSSRERRDDGQHRVWRHPDISVPQADVEAGQDGMPVKVLH